MPIKALAPDSDLSPNTWVIHGGFSTHWETLRTLVAGPIYVRAISDGLIENVGISNFTPSFTSITQVLFYMHYIYEPIGADTARLDVSGTGFSGFSKFLTSAGFQHTQVLPGSWNLAQLNALTIQVTSSNLTAGDIVNLRSVGFEITYEAPVPATAPSTPTNISPADNATGISLTPNLVSSAYFQSGGTTSHATSQWQIVGIWNSGESNSNLTNKRVPSGVLSTNTTYSWSVRHKGSNNEWSHWSSSTSFTTSATATTNYVRLHPMVIP